MRIATSLKESIKHRLPALRVASAPEMVCADYMCEKFGEHCLCRFSFHLERLAHVRHLDLREMGLTAVPHVWKMAQLETLDLRENQIVSIPAELADAPRLASVLVDEYLRDRAPPEIKHLLARADAPRTAPD